MANGNVAPTRVIEGQATKLARTIHGIAYNPVRDEIVVSNPLAAAILVYRGGANGDEPPLRVIQGRRTGLVYPHSVALDVDNEEIIVLDFHQRNVMVFRSDANGDVEPRRVIQGPTTKLDRVIGAAVDPERNLLVVTSMSADRSGAGQTGLFIFNRTANGNVSPKAVIAGPNTGMVAIPWDVRVFQGKIFVAVANAPYYPVYNLHTLEVRKATEGVEEISMPWSSDLLGFIGIWNITDSGDIAPRAIIKGPVSGLVHPGGVGLNPEQGELIVADSVKNSLFTFQIP